jgi:hypothetical protein
MTGDKTPDRGKDKGERHEQAGKDQKRDRALSLMATNFGRVALKNRWQRHKSDRDGPRYQKDSCRAAHARRAVDMGLAAMAEKRTGQVCLETVLISDRLVPAETLLIDRADDWLVGMHPPAPKLTSACNLAHAGNAGRDRQGCRESELLLQHGSADALSSLRKWAGQDSACLAPKPGARCTAGFANHAVGGTGS